MRKFPANARTWLKVENLRTAKRLIVFVVGVTVVLIGVALIVLPGPAVLVIPFGLAILATEFAWARRWLDKTRGMFDRTKNRKPNKPNDQAVV